ncbi:MAG: hypothetical protein ABIP14_00300, partial [Blastocatellia bacterium]
SRELSSPSLRVSPPGFEILTRLPHSTLLVNSISAFAYDAIALGWTSENLPDPQLDIDWMIPIIASGLIKEVLIVANFGLCKTDTLVSCPPKRSPSRNRSLKTIWGKKGWRRCLLFSSLKKGSVFSPMRLGITNRVYLLINLK